MVRLLSKTFPSVKPRNPNPSKSPKSPSQSSLPLPISPKSKPKSPSASNSRSRLRCWCVYLILSTNKPIKTYVGITTNFTRRLKQHNGKLKGGAKASCAGRPWVCACIIRGFDGRSEASAFEYKWKSISRKLPRKRETEDIKKQKDAPSLALLEHRRTALDKVTGSLDCRHLKINWKFDPS